MTELELRQMFKNLSDCYADTGRFENDGSYTEGEVIQAMTEDRFIEALKEAKFITSNTVLCDSGCDCPISNTDKVHFCDKCTPKMYGC
jgi:hypothetical protein